MPARRYWLVLATPLLANLHFDGQGRHHARPRAERQAVRLGAVGLRAGLRAVTNPGGTIPPPAITALLDYKGDSVLAAQRHFLDCLARGAPRETEGRAYLQTIALVEDCYRPAAW
jgi:hypothetical protein